MPEAFYFPECRDAGVTSGAEVAVALAGTGAVVRPAGPPRQCRRRGAAVRRFAGHPGPGGRGAGRRGRAGHGRGAAGQRPDHLVGAAARALRGDRRPERDDPDPRVRRRRPGRPGRSRGHPGPAGRDAGREGPAAGPGRAARGHRGRGGGQEQCRATAAALRAAARPADRDHDRARGRARGQGGRQGGQERGRLRPGQAVRRVGRHAGPDRRGDVPAAPAARPERLGDREVPRQRGRGRGGAGRGGLPAAAVRGGAGPAPGRAGRCG